MGFEMTTRPLSRREWLMSDRPQSRMQARLGRAYLVWSRFASNKLAVVGLCIIIALLLVAAFANVLAPHSPVIGDLRNARLLPPGGEYLLGTDDQGRDILSRLIYGSRLTLYVVILVAIIAAPIGLLVGTIAGYAGGWTDAILMRITDIFLAFPEAHSGPRLRRRPRTWHRERGHCHRDHLLAALCAYRARRNADRAQLRLHRRGAADGRVAVSHRVAPHHAAVPLIADRARNARHGRHHPDGRRAWLSWPRRAAAAAGMGRDDRLRPTLHHGPMVGCGSPGFAILIVSLGFNLLGDGLRDALDPRGSNQ